MKDTKSSRSEFRPTYSGGAHAEPPADGARSSKVQEQLSALANLTVCPFPGLLGPVDPSFRALSGRLEFMVRRHKFNTDSLLHSGLTLLRPGIGRQLYRGMSVPCAFRKDASWPPLSGRKGVHAYALEDNWKGVHSHELGDNISQPRKHQTVVARGGERSKPFCVSHPHIPAPSPFRPQREHTF